MTEFSDKLDEFLDENACIVSGLQLVRFKPGLAHGITPARPEFSCPIGFLYSTFLSEAHAPWRLSAVGLGHPFDLI